MCISSIKKCYSWVHLWKIIIYLDRLNQTTMDNYLITVGMYLILMLFFKIYFAVAAND